MAPANGTKPISRGQTVHPLGAGALGLANRLPGHSVGRIPDGDRMPSPLAVPFHAIPDAKPCAGSGTV